MAQNIPDNEKQGPTTKTTLCSKVPFKVNGKNRELPRQKAKIVCLYQVTTTRDAKWNAIKRSRKRERQKERERNTGTEKNSVNKYI